LGAEFFHETTAQRLLESATERVAELLGSLDPAGVGRKHDDRLAARLGREVLDKERQGFQVIGAAAEGILKGRHVMHIEGHHAVYPDCLE
jgi:hypothetical protein